MALENVAKFEERLSADEELQAKLKDLCAAWEGDEGDEEGLFEATVAPVAAEAGLPFTYEELKEGSGVRDMDDAELDAVAGGDALCGFIGVSDEPEVKCYGIGHMCAYIGITIGIGE